MNRINEIRKQQKISQAKIAEFLNTTPQAISLYEKAQREPKIETWEKLANYFKVPTPYLMGVSDDPVDWGEWVKKTGYSKQLIDASRTFLVANHRLTGKEVMYDQINATVHFLNEDVGTDTAVKRYVDSEFFRLIGEVTRQYEDPQKVAKLPSNPLERAKLDLKPSATFYDDMDANVYQQIHDILTDARNKINAIPTKK